jgi:hypothetical protein
MVMKDNTAAAAVNLPLGPGQPLEAHLVDAVLANGQLRDVPGGVAVEADEAWPAEYYRAGVRDSGSSVGGGQSSAGCTIP